MKTIKFTRIVLGYALLGALIFGSIFGFWFSGETLEAIRASGAITSILAVIIFAPNTLIS